jgi:hypothetical protein
LSYVPRCGGAQAIVKKNDRVKKSPAASAGDFVRRLPPSLAQQQDQDDQRNRNSNQPEQNGHVIFLSVESTG